MRGSESRCAGCGEITGKPHSEDCEVLSGLSEARMIEYPDGAVRLTMPDGTLVEGRA
jgi:hypothetical protein